MAGQSWRVEISVLRLAIVISDGESNDPSRTVKATKAVHAHSPQIVVYAIGIGKSINETELRLISSGPQAYSHIDSLSSGLLNSVGESYSYQICYTSKRIIY